MSNLEKIITLLFLVLIIYEFTAPIKLEEINTKLPSTCIEAIKSNDVWIKNAVDSGQFLKSKISEFKDVRNSYLESYIGFYEKINSNNADEYLTLENLIDLCQLGIIPDNMLNNMNYYK